MHIYDECVLLGLEHFLEALEVGELDVGLAEGVDEEEAE